MTYECPLLHGPHSWATVLGGESSTVQHVNPRSKLFHSSRHSNYLGFDTILAVTRFPLSVWQVQTSHSLLLLDIVFAIAITCIAVILRLLAGQLNKTPLGADDYCLFVGAVSLLTFHGNNWNMLWSLTFHGCEIFGLYIKYVPSIGIYQAETNISVPSKRIWK